MFILFFKRYGSSMNSKFEKKGHIFYESTINFFLNLRNVKPSFISKFASTFVMPFYKKHMYSNAYCGNINTLICISASGRICLL